MTTDANAGDLVAEETTPGNAKLGQTDYPTDAALPPRYDQRLASVDTLRGLTILLMIFVNDLGPAGPAWIHHIQPPDADGMTLADIVFPGFLFIVGISIPLAIERSIQLGRRRSQIVGHILTRTLGLLIMGLIGVNRADDISLPGPLWGILAYTSIILAWCIVPKEASLRRKVLIGLKGIGVIGLIALLAIYRRPAVTTEVMFLGSVENWPWLTTQWWGILGLIGWAYLTAAMLYLLLRGRREWLMAGMALLLVNYLALSNGGFFTRVDDKPWLSALRPMIDAIDSSLAFVGSYVDLRSGPGSLAAITMAGALLGTTLAGPNKLLDHRSRLRWAAAFTIGLFIAGIAMDTFAGVNKIAATPTWCLWCAAITCGIWAVVYRFMDVGGYVRWSFVVQPAGANPLIAYLLHPVLVLLISLFGLGAKLTPYKDSTDAWIVIGGSIAMALVVCALTGLIARAGLRVRI